MHENDSHVVEAALALCWIPFAAIGWMLRDDASRTAGCIGARRVM
jgi:hypothetical protein